jgi:hypothetical protein
MSSVPTTTPSPPPVIRVDEQQVQQHLDSLVRTSVEQTLNASTSPTFQ